MSTKLFRAVVGLGISIGSAVAACDGAADVTPLGDGGGVDAASAADGASTPPDSASVVVEASADVVEGEDAADASADDASDGAPTDALADAFCDAAWPTTKGQVILPNCLDPSGRCWDAAAPIRCMAALGPHQCDIQGSGVAGMCVFTAEAGSSVPDADADAEPAAISAAWMCPPNTIPMDQCWCFGELGDGQVCTDAGPQP